MAYSDYESAAPMAGAAGFGGLGLLGPIGLGLAGLSGGLDMYMGYRDAMQNRKDLRRARYRNLMMENLAKAQQKESDVAMGIEGGRLEKQRMTHARQPYRDMDRAIKSAQRKNRRNRRLGMFRSAAGIGSNIAGGIAGLNQPQYQTPLELTGWSAV